MRNVLLPPSRGLNRALRREADRLGVETSFVAADGLRVEADADSVAAVVALLADDAARGAGEVVVIGGPAGLGPPDLDWDRIGDAELVLEDGTILAGQAVREALSAGVATLPVGRHTMRSADTGGATSKRTVVVAPPSMPGLPDDARQAAVFTPAYGLWSASDPLPSFGHLGDLAALLGERGVDVLFTLPLYDLFFDEPYDPSPYSPASRLHWNEVFIDDATLPGAPLPTPPTDPASVELRQLARRRRRQLIDAAAALGDAELGELDAFAAARPDVVDYARFRAARDPSDRSRALVERSYVLAQLLAHRQLDAAGRRGAALGLDLPIGSHADGYETWALPDRFAAGFSVGAPPDPLAPDGQDWGFFPQLPSASRRSGHELWWRLVERASEHAGVLRIDHVMAVHRLWWIPPGAPSSAGVYVRYPVDEVLAVIAAAAARHSTTVVGENLGTVPPEVDAAMQRWGMLGMHEEGFHLGDRELPPIRRRTVAGIRTHDMPAFAAAIAAGDGDGDGERRLRAPAYEAAMCDIGAGSWSDADAALEYVLARLARSDAVLTVADLDDVRGETEPHNTPGHPSATTWRRRSDVPLPELVSAAPVEARLQMITTRGGAPSRDEVADDE